MRNIFLVKVKRIILIVCMALLLTACDKTTASVSTPEMQVNTTVPEVEQKKSEPLGMLEKATLEYTVPNSVPSIFVNRIGYLPEGNKVAVLTGERLPSSFSVKDAVTNEIVFSGNVKVSARKDDSDGLKSGTIDFSGLTTEGRFYIETDILGHSYDFEIKKDLYETLFSEAFMRLHDMRCGDVRGTSCHTEKVPFENNAQQLMDVSGGWHTDAEGQKDVTEGCLAVIDLLNAFEYYSSSFNDAMGIFESGNKKSDILDEIRYETDWLLKMQNSTTGGVYTSVSLQTMAGATEKTMVVVGESTKSTAYFCAALTRFSTIYNKYDSKYSSNCLKAAVKAWKCLVANKDLVTNFQLYRAATELYRATGSSEYKSVIDEYLKVNIDNDFGTRGEIDAAITYMSTKNDINVTYCNTLMSRFMDLTQDKADACEDTRFFVDSTNCSLKELLRNTEELSIIDYIISGRQYENLEKEYIDYFCGRNPDSKIYVYELINPDDCAMLLCILARLQN